MTTEKEILSALSAPFPASAVSWRVGATNKDKTSGVALAYIDARDVMDRLDEVVGCDSWGDTYAETPSGRVICALGVRLNGEWIIKSDGAGATDFEGEKGGISDAFKRAAVKFGIGRYLYRLDAPWVPIKQRGRSFILESDPKLPAWALPGGEAPPEPEPEKPKEEPKPKRNDPVELMRDKLDILAQRFEVQEVKSFLNMFLKQCDCVPDARSIDDLKGAPVTDQWVAYNHFKVKANQAFDAGFSEGR